MRLIYLDHFATTPLDQRVFDAMMPFFRQDFGNPASDGHLFGQRAKTAVEWARSKLHIAVGAMDGDAVIFTSGATESNNLVLRGLAERLGQKRRHIVVSGIEHKSVLEPSHLLHGQGYRVTVLPVNSAGMVDPDQVADAITDETLLVSVMAVNNEVGAVQALESIGAATRARGVLLHCDATQGLGKVPLEMRRQGIDFLSVSAHKIYGPKGVGALCIASPNASALLAPQALGGGQEGRLRSGTLNVPGIVGLAKAVEVMCEQAPAERLRIRALRDLLLRGLEKSLDGVTVNGDLLHAIPGALNVSVEGIRSTALLARLRGIAFSGAAACGGQSAKSHVLSAMGLSRERIQSALRFGIGRFNTTRDIETAVEQIALEVKWIRNQPRFGLEQAS